MTLKSPVGKDWQIRKITVSILCFSLPFKGYGLSNNTCQRGSCWVFRCRLFSCEASLDSSSYQTGYFVHWPFQTPYCFCGCCYYYRCNWSGKLQLCNSFTLPWQILCPLTNWLIYNLGGSRDAAVVRALASHQCVQGLILEPGVICGLSLLLVLYSALRGFSPSTPVFPSPQKPTFDLI